MPNFGQRILSLIKKIQTRFQRFYFFNKTGGHMRLQSSFFISSGLMLEYIVMNLFSYITEQKKDLVKNDSFSKIKDGKIYLYQGSLQDYS